MPKLCEFENCRKRANYGPNRTTYKRCKEHCDGMKLCKSLCNCGKAHPSFNEPSQTKPICCSQCKTKTMVNVKHTRCSCGKAHPSFNEPGETNAICCSKCRTKTMVNVKSKKCKCGQAIPYFNEPGETNAICCSKCKTGTMVNVVSKKCRCGKYPIYNEPGESKPICCSECKTKTMINVRSKRCRCGKAQPHYNEPGENKAICCSKCRTDSMVNVKIKKCKGWINKTLTPSSGPCPSDMKANKKYRNYCTECFKYNFPLDPLTFQINCKTKEIAVKKFLNANFKDFYHDRAMPTGHCACTVRRRIDHRKLIGNTLLAIETDENQHKSYDQMDEETRYNDLFMAYSGKWIYIRFNPDKYKNSKGQKRNQSIATRLLRLKEEILKQIKRIENEENTELVERIYLYYDGYDH